MNIKETIKNRMCSGCGICESICPKSAIAMQYNTIGNILPVLNEKCIDCGLCLTVCPGSSKAKDYDIATDTLFYGNIIKTYIGRSLNSEIYRNSQSGGVVTALLYFLFSKQMIDAAIVSKSSPGYPYPDTVPTIITKKEDLFQTQKSIYTPVPVLSILKEIACYNSVAIVGLPCQLEAVKIAQDKGKYKNITIKIGLICDRILSRSIYLSLMPREWNPEDYTCTFKDKSYPLNEMEYSAIFRDKNYKNYKTACMVYKANNNIFPLSPYPRHYAKDFFTHPRCRICFNKLNTFADITCGDPWNMEGVDWQNGDSLVISRNCNGEKLLSKALSDGFITLKECKVEDVIKAQGIETRRKRCLAGIEIYKRNAWSIPVVYQRIYNDANDCDDKKIPFKNENKLVRQFIKTESLSLKKILYSAEKFKKKNAYIMKKNKIKTWFRILIKTIIYLNRKK